MVIYSEILDKKFETVDECLEAEAKYKFEQEAKKKAEKEHQKKLDKAYDKAMKAIDEYLELAGVKIEETDNGYKVEYHKDGKADGIWEDIVETFVNF